MSEASLQKLKVTELKELLHKHDLPQTGKKDDLVKRLLENNIAPESGEEELVDPDADEATTETAPAAPEASSSTAPTTAEPPAATPSEAPATEQTLTPDQQAMKARAERFGLPFNPNATPSSARTKPTPTAPKATEPVAAATPAPGKKEKAGAIDKTPLGISEDVLAKRAAKFGIPEKKEAEPVKEAAAPAAKPASTPAPKAEVELTPEQKEQRAADEEKKRKRAEKFGTAKPANGVESEGSEAKKAKV